MMKFTTCPKCKAQIEDLPGTKCWNCGHVPGGKNVPASTGDVNIIGQKGDYDFLTDQSVSFKICSNCGSQCEAFAAKCWQCGVKFPGVAPNVFPDGSEHSAIEERKKVPFADKTAKAPEIKKKPGIIDAVAKVFKATEYIPEEEITDEVKQEERDLKKARKLILFRCPRCGGYFKVIFRRVHHGVKCPECKDTRMKIPYFCTKCKISEDFDTFDPHVCKTCHLDMVLDPNFE
nr:hypothetical protein [Candidatus Sigynarchaeota archaeon]